MFLIKSVTADPTFRIKPIRTNLEQIRAEQISLAKFFASARLRIAWREGFARRPQLRPLLLLQLSLLPRWQFPPSAFSQVQCKCPIAMNLSTFYLATAHTSQRTSHI